MTVNVSPPALGTVPLPVLYDLHILPDAALDPRVTLAILPAGYFADEDVCSHCPDDGDIPPAEILITYRYEGGSGRVYQENACCGYCADMTLRYVLRHGYPLVDITYYA